MMKGIPCDFAIDDNLFTSSSVKTFPLGLVGLETQIAAISSVILRLSKSTLYLKDLSPVSSMRPGFEIKRSS